MNFIIILRTSFDNFFQNHILHANFNFKLQQFVIKLINETTTQPPPTPPTTSTTTNIITKLWDQTNTQDVKKVQQWIKVICYKFPTHHIFCALPFPGISTCSPENKLLLIGAALSPLWSMELWVFCWGARYELPFLNFILLTRGHGLLRNYRGRQGGSGGGEAS